MIDTRPIPRTTALGFRTAVCHLVLSFAFGCGGKGHPPDGSPVVAPDSEAATRAITERERMIRDRAEQEAKARARRPDLPVEG